MQDLADFLGSHPPFDAVEPEDVARVAAMAETEYYPTGKTIFSQGTGPVEYVWVVRTGSVEIVYDRRVLDLLGPGELFGHASMLSGLPTGFEARAGEDTHCCRIPAEVMRPLLARPEVLRFVARTMVSDRGAHADAGTPSVDPIQRRVATLIRSPPVLCRADEPIRETARRMTAEGASAVLVRSGESGGALGIVTDRDLRSRVVAAGLSPEAPISAIMTTPAYTVTGDRLGGEVLLDMLERGVHHIPVLSAAGDVLGVVDEGDLVAAEARKPFLLRRAISRAATLADLAATSADLGQMIVALHDARVAAEHIAAVGSVVLDALTRRLIELAVADAGDPPVPFTWFALGSLARREAVPSSDIDSALAWPGASGGEPSAGAGPSAGGNPDSDDDPAVRDYMTRVAEAVEDGLRACGQRPDANGATASSPLFARSMQSWRTAARRLSENPGREQAVILVSVIVDSRPVWTAGPGDSVAGGLWEARSHPDLLRLLARLALSYRPPTGFLRDFVVEHSGERKGQLDIKHGGLIPIVDLARWAGMSVGVAGAPTAERLRAAEAGGALESSAARMLAEAFDFIFALRLDHQVEQLRRGEAPDDFIDPTTLNPLARSCLRSAFRAIASVQSGLANELALGVRWG